MRRCIGLCGLAVSLALGLAPVVAAQTPDASCFLLSRSSDRYAEAPLAGFDPGAATLALPVKIPDGASALVLCHRAIIVPELTDYRVPAELHVALAITDERKVLVLQIVGGRLQAEVRKGVASPQEEAEVKARLEEMQSAMQGAQPQQ